MSRRGLFDRAVRRCRGAATSVAAEVVARLDSVEDPPDDKKRGEGPSPPWLRTAVGQRLAAMPPAVDTVVGAPVTARPRVDESCQPCPICEAACPNGALIFDRSGATQLSLIPEGCTACGACVAACPQRALRLDESVTLSEWGRGMVRLVRGRTVGCPVCGRDALSAQVGLCARCYRTRGGVRS